MRAPRHAAKKSREARGAWGIAVEDYHVVAVMRAWFHQAPFPASGPHPRLERLFKPAVDLTRRAVVRHYSRKVLKRDSVVCEKLQAIASQIRPMPVLGGLEERLGWLEESYAEAMEAK